jgi:hypothetical protein
MAAGFLIGLDMKLYRNTGTYASPTWDLISNVKDLTLSESRGKADVSNRASDWRKNKSTLNELMASWKMNYDSSDTDFTTLQSAYRARTTVEFAFADGLIGTSGTQYVRASCELFKFERAEPLEGSVEVDVEAGPTYAANDPSSATVP